MDKSTKTANKKGKMVVIDGNALIHRSFHALPPTMATKAGEMVNAVYGFTSVLIKAIRELKPDYVVLTLDRKGPTFRHEEYKEYKATRTKAPDELYAQIGRVREVAGVFGVPVFELDGFEADDLIGTIVASVDGKIEKIILTGDMDTLQLVNEHTKVYTMSRGLTDTVLYDEAGVRSRFGLEPDQIVDYKALRGDPSDNIPGVKGIGEKTAVELLQKFGSLEKLYDNLESPEIKDRIRELLKTYKDDAFMSQRLSTIRLDAKIDFDLEAARFGDFDQNKLVNLFSELEFKSLLPKAYELVKQGAGERQIGEAGQNGGYADKFERNRKTFDYSLIDDEKKFDSFLKKLAKQKEFVFDTETSDCDPLTSKLLGISFCWREGQAFFVSFRPRKASSQQPAINLFNYNHGEAVEEKMHPWLEALKPIFANDKVKKFGHNIKFDVAVMDSQGVPVKGVAFDTMIASYLLNPGTRQHNLDAATFTFLGFEKISKDDLLGRGKDKLTFPEVEVEKLSLYSCEDADFTYRLKQRLAGELKAHHLVKLFEEIEMPLVSVLEQMERYGIKLDTDHLRKLSKKLHGQIEKLEREIHAEAGEKFNINSTQQLRQILFEKMEIVPLGVGKTKTGFSTAADELEKLKDQHAIIALIQSYRELTKLCNTYIDALPQLINPKTGHLHTSYNQTVAATGRLSSSDPNLQNIPIRGRWGEDVRRAFVAEEGYKLLALDYSQIELRLMAHMSGDKKMIEAFRQGVDIHSMTAAEINEVPLEEVTKKMRSEAKAVNFGIIYGQGPHGLSQSADIPYIRAKEFIDNYFAVYPGIKKFMEKTIDVAKEKGYVETLLGRRRYLPELNSSVMQVRKQAERMAVNTPLQGTAADMIKVAMIRVDEFLNKQYSGGEAKMILQVHDELLFEVRADLVEQLAPAIKQMMEEVIKLKVPIVVDVKAGQNWGEA